MIELKRKGEEVKVVYLLDPDVKVEDAERSRRWVPMDTVDCNGATTVATVRPVSFFDAQKAEADGSANGEAAQIVGMLRAGLVALDNGGCSLEEFLADPSCAHAMALYNYVHGLTWGN